MKLKPTSLLIAGALMGAAVLPVQADPMVDLLKVLRDKGTISAEDYSLLANAAKAKEEKATAEKEEIVSIVKETEKKSSLVTLDSKGLNFKSSDGAFTANIGGRIHADYGFVNDDFFGSANPGLGVNESGDGAFFRRARLGMEGTMFTDWIYGLEINYNGGAASSNAGFTDAIIGYKGFENTTIKLGRHKMPAGLEELTSSNRISTMERSGPTNTFALSRFNGLTVATKGTNWTATGGMWMGEGDGDRDNNNQDSDWGYAGRATFAPIQEKDSIVHLGLSYSKIEYENNFTGTSITTNNGRLRQRAGNRFVDDRPVQVTYAGTEDADTYGLEAATIQGPFSLQGEYFQRTLNRKDFKDADVDGWYVLSTFTLTGETRGYRDGVMRTISPKNPVGKGGFGAWELVARYDVLDLWDSSAASEGVSGIRGTESNIWTLGVNWYVNDNIRFMANYVDADIKSDAASDIEGDVKAFMLRGQVAF
ncbi:OprO/OprP family phosphate-selective porin [Methylophaga sp. SB9B]|uniref:OprO/OprP family phosphate-selective porin n=1 Tax=Methylophaga sp. SB9B TaxID=2570356 RepID=UPI0014562D7F|nr:porin [Methylophaga sp. SB9B]